MAVDIRTRIKFNGSYVPSYEEDPKEKGIDGYTGWYGSSDGCGNRFSLNIYAASYIPDTHKIHVYYRIKAWKGATGGYSLTAVASYLSTGTLPTTYEELKNYQYYRKDPGDPMGGDAGSFLSGFTEGNYSSGTNVLHGTFELPADQTSWKVGVRGMCHGGWGWNRWTESTYTRTEVNFSLSVDESWKEDVYNAGQLYRITFYDEIGTGNMPNTMYCQKNGYFTLPNGATWPNRVDTLTTTFDPVGGTCNTSTLQTTRTLSYHFDSWLDYDSETFHYPGESIQATKDMRYGTDFHYTTSTPSITLPTATKTNYNFKGWSENGTTPITTTTYTPTKNITLYAVWELAQLLAYIKTGGVWKQGYVFMKTDEKWEKVKKAFVKKEGTWRTKD